MYSNNHIICGFFWDTVRWISFTSVHFMCANVMRCYKSRIKVSTSKDPTRYHGIRRNRTTSNLHWKWEWYYTQRKEVWLLCYRFMNPSETSCTLEVNQLCILEGIDFFQVEWITQISRWLGSFVVWYLPFDVQKFSCNILGSLQTT